MKIKLKIFSTFVLASMILTIAGVSAFYYFSYRNLRLLTANNISTTAKDKAAWLNSFFYERKGDAKILAASPVVISLLASQTITAEGGAYLKDFQRSRGYEDIILIKADDTIWWASSNNFGDFYKLNDSSLQNNNLAQAYLRAKQLRQPIISDYGEHLLNSQPAIFIVTPVYDQ